jgi:uncharacterized protein YukJ
MCSPQQSPSELLYVADEAFQHPLLQAPADLSNGFTPVPNTAGGPALVDGAHERLCANASGCGVEPVQQERDRCDLGKRLG